MSKETPQKNRKGLKPWVLLLILAWLFAWAYQSYNREHSPDFGTNGVSKFCADPEHTANAEARAAAEKCNENQRHHAKTGEWMP